MTDLRDWYPPIEPYRIGTVDVGDGHRLHLEESGNPAGKPVVFLHGGPGGGTSPDQRRFFDPERYRIVLFDQRGCGLSTPHASAVDADLSSNTTWHLVSDIEVVRRSLEIESWQVFGGSWGSALALAYAQTHPQRVTELVLRGIFTLRRVELDWFYNGPAGIMAPDAWEGFRAPLLEHIGDAVELLDADGRTPDPLRDNIARYHDLLWSPDRAVAEQAGTAWTNWEDATVTLEPRPATDEPDVEYDLAFARIENHYFTHGGWFTDGQLIAGVDAIRHIPCTIVQGRYDLCCPARTAWDLAQAWPEADFRLVLAGHSAFEPAIRSELIAATDRYAG